MSDEPLRRLLRSLALVEGFGFYILLCPARRELDLALETMARELPAMRGKPVQFVRLDPYADLPEGKLDPGWEDLERVILKPLVEPPAEGRVPGSVYVLDATLVRGEDELCSLLLAEYHRGHWLWKRLFGRLNELRNRISSGLDGALILAISRHMDVTFTSGAPDLWSIRSGDFAEDACPRELAPCAPGELGRLAAEVIQRSQPLDLRGAVAGIAGALDAAHREDWSAVAAWAENAARTHQEEPSLRLFLLHVRYLRGLLDTLSLDRKESSNRVLSMIEQHLLLLDATGDIFFRYLFVHLGAWAECLQDPSFAYSCYRAWFEHWSENNGEELEGYTLAVRAALGGFRCLAAMGRPDLGSKALGLAESLVMSAQELPDKKFGPTSTQFKALSEAYSSLGDERRARHHAARASEAERA